MPTARPVTPSGRYPPGPVRGSTPAPTRPSAGPAALPLHVTTVGRPRTTSMPANGSGEIASASPPPSASSQPAAFSNAPASFVTPQASDEPNGLASSADGVVGAASSGAHDSNRASKPLAVAVVAATAEAADSKGEAQLEERYSRRIEEEAISKLERLGYPREEIVRQLKDESSHLCKLYHRFLKALTAWDSKK